MKTENDTDNNREWLSIVAELGLTPPTITMLTGVNRSTIAGYKSGVSRPPALSLAFMRLLRFLKVSNQQLYEDLFLLCAYGSLDSEKPREVLEAMRTAKHPATIAKMLAESRAEIAPQAIRKGFVYLVTDDYDRLKIGKTFDVDKRLPQQLRSIAKNAEVMPGGGVLQLNGLFTFGNGTESDAFRAETEAHQHFDKYRYDDLPVFDGSTEYFRVSWKEARDYLLSIGCTEYKPETVK